MDTLHELVLEEHCADDDAKLTAKEIHSYLGRIMYNKRNKMDPLYNRILIAGHKEDGQSFLGYLDQFGTQFEEDFFATGFGTHMALPLIRDVWRPDLTEEETRKLMEDCMRVLWYRDTKALNKFQLAKITAAEGAVISEPYGVDTKWDHESFVKPKAAHGGSW